MEQAGIRERSSRRRFGDYRIVDLLDDVEADSDTGIAYQDFLVEHVNLAGMRRRLRPIPSSSTPQRSSARRRAVRRAESSSTSICSNTQGSSPQSTSSTMSVVPASSLSMIRTHNGSTDGYSTRQEKWTHSTGLTSSVRWPRRWLMPMGMGSFIACSARQQCG